jgi:hypothetical protein
LGVLGVGSDPVVYLPASKEPPDLDSMPMGWLTGAMPPDTVAPTDADSVIFTFFMRKFAGTPEDVGIGGEAGTVYVVVVPDEALVISK